MSMVRQIPDVHVSPLSNRQEINHAGEGGLYPELLCDRSFDAFAYHKSRSKSDIQRLALALNSGFDHAPPASRSSSALQVNLGNWMYLFLPNARGA